MSDSRTGEAVYKEFIEFRDAFLTDAMDEASARSTNKYGEKFRPVVLVSARRLKNGLKLSNNGISSHKNSRNILSWASQFRYTNQLRNSSPELYASALL